MQFTSVNFGQNHFKFEIGYFSPITLPPKYIYIYIYIFTQNAVWVCKFKELK